MESGRRWVKDSHPFEGPTDDARGPPTFDLYRPLSIFRNLLLRILNVRISARQIRWQPKRRERERARLARRCSETRRRRRQQPHQKHQQFLLPTSAPPWGDAALIFPRISSFLPCHLSLRFLSPRCSILFVLSRVEIVLSVSIPFLFSPSLPPPAIYDSISTICTAVDR